MSGRAHGTLRLTAERAAFEAREIERLGEAAAREKRRRQWRKIFEERAPLVARLLEEPTPDERAEILRRIGEINAEIHAETDAEKRAQEAWERAGRPSPAEM